MPIAKPSTSPSEATARTLKGQNRDRLIENLSTFPKGCFRTAGAAGAVPFVVAAGVTSAATYFAASFLQLFLVMLYGDKDGNIKDEIGKALLGQLDTIKNTNQWLGNKIFNVEWDQFKEAMSEICGQEDSKKHQPVPADFIKQVETLTPEQADKILDTINAREELDLENIRAGVDATSGR